MRTQTTELKPGKANSTALFLLLETGIANAIDLALQAKQAHWNVKGPNFFSLHALFDEVAKEAGEYGDMIAERYVQLGGVADGRIQAVTQKTSLPKYPITSFNGDQHVDAMIESVSTFSSHIKQCIETSSESDPVTCDMFTEISRRIDKYQWFLESHKEVKTSH